MSPKNDYVYAFLTDLKSQRAVKKRLIEKAKDEPELILAYIDSLPLNWKNTFEDDEVELLGYLERLARAHVGNR